LEKQKKKAYLLVAASLLGERQFSLSREEEAWRKNSLKQRVSDNLRTWDKGTHVPGREGGNAQLLAPAQACIFCP
jgi:hypothetical protein